MFLPRRFPEKQRALSGVGPRCRSCVRQAGIDCRTAAPTANIALSTCQRSRPNTEVREFEPGFQTSTG
jgi:hypothetical protein